MRTQSQHSIPARQRAWKSIDPTVPARIDHGDLTALLYVQGYRREEFVE